MKGQKCAILMLQLEVIHKLCLQEEGVGGQKNLLFVNFYTIENVNGGGRWSKKTNLET